MMGHTVSRRYTRLLLHSFHVTTSWTGCRLTLSRTSSRYARILRDSRVYRGQRTGNLLSTTKESPFGDSKPTGIVVTAYDEGKLSESSLASNLLEDDNVCNPTSDTDHLNHEDIDSLIMHPSISDSKERKGHHIFDEEYFRNITQALTNQDSESAIAPVEIKQLNIFDAQYFETITKKLTNHGSEQEGNEHSVVSEVHQDKQGRAHVVAPHGDQTNLFDEHYFGNVTEKLTAEWKEQDDNPVTGDVNHCLTMINHDSVLSPNTIPLDPEALVGISSNIFDRQYFESTPNMNSGESSRFPLVETSKDSSEVLSVIEAKINEEASRNVGFGNKPQRQLGMDTRLSEREYFRQNHMEHKMKEGMTNVDEVLELPIEHDFTPAETALGLNNSTSDTGYSHTMSSLHSKGISLSQTDRMNLEIKRERLENTTSLEDIRNKSLEPEVSNVIKLHKKTKPVLKPKTSQEIELFGSPDPSVPASKHNCTGCGALLHCKDIMQPGYLPSELFKTMLKSNELEDAICQRCWHFVHHKQALNINLNAVDHKKIISEIRTKRANILVMVDLVDFPCSVIPDLKSMVGEKAPMFIVGNKFDLLPKDSPDYQQRVEKILLETCIQENVCNESQVVKVHLISAKTGYGVESLITELQKMWGSRRDVYLLGTANIGKSTLFKTLLNSDFSKAKASYLIKEPTISPWPGTTLNLLKFPIMRPTPDKLAVRNARLKDDAKKAAAAEAKFQSKKYNRSRIRLSAYVEGKVGRSFSIQLKVDELDEMTEIEPAVDFDDPFNTAHPDISRNPAAVTKPKKKDLIKFKPVEFDLGKWLYDTPGVLHDRQVLTQLTMAELKETMARRVIIPRTLTMKPGHVIFLGGLGRLDYLQGKKSIYFTVFASEALPVRYCSLEEADDYYRTHAGQRYFRVPIGGEERMKTFPQLLPTDIQVKGCGWQESAADVVLSSAGWVAVTAGPGMQVDLRAFTPDGHGCFMRPALLPFAIKMKGRRPNKNKPFYTADPKAVLRFR